MEFAGTADIAKVGDIINAKSKSAGRKYLAYTHVFGCAQNTADMENIRGMLECMGYGFCDEAKFADIIVINTCAVREGAESRIYGNVGQFKKLKEQNPELIVCVCGCMMQQPQVVEKLRKSYPYVDIIFGTHNIDRFPALVLNKLSTGKRTFEILDKSEITEGMPSRREPGGSCNVSIMYGCDNFCSYCIVPYTRGREKSRKPENVLAEIKALAAAGYTEINLLGQNVNSYGKGLEEKITFAQLLKQVNDIPGVRRIRFMTSHPKDLSDELIETMATCDKVCKSLHLPFQAGCTRVLEKMNRRYTKEQYLELVMKIKKRIPGIALTTDVIVGFPGETTEEFEHTLDVLKKVRFDGVFSFIYSRRTGTVAAKMEDVISEEEKHANLERLLKVQQDINFEINSGYVGNEYEVLVDGTSKTKDNLLTGHTDTNKIVHFVGDESLIGTYKTVKITEAKSFYLKGELL